MSPAGVELARELLLLGAESAVAVPSHQVVGGDECWPGFEERWWDLGERLRGFERDCVSFDQHTRSDLADDALPRWLELLCAAVELYPEGAAAASLLAEDERVHLLTPAVFARLMRQIFDVPFAESLTEALGGAAIRLGWIEVSEPVAGRPLTQRALRLSPDRLGELLRPAASAGDDLRRNVERLAPAEGVVHDPTRVAGASELLAEHHVLCIRDSSRRACLQFAHDLASSVGQAALVLRPGDRLPAPDEVAGLAAGGLAVLDLSSAAVDPATLYTLALDSDRLAALQHLRLRLVILLSANAEPPPLPTVSVEPLGFDLSRRVWRLAGYDTATSTELARRYRINLEEVRSVMREAESEIRVSGATGDAVTVRELTRWVRARGARRMGHNVVLVESTARLDQLVAPGPLRDQIDDILAWYRASARVFSEMRMAETSRLGRGLVCLFSGPPGTGKTFAAQCLANELELNLYRIDLSQVVSKYIGETEKALATVFDEAEAGHGILLFDEADSLFGRRSAVKDAHDRYANIEVGFLLQRLEAFEGVAFLATNLRSNLDPAFVRRIRFLLDFPMPDLAMRTRLWEQALPAAAFRDPGLDYRPLAEQFRLSGGSIHNIGLAAAHLAAATPEGRITARHLVRATYRELEKSGLSRSPAEFRELAGYLPEAVA
jgi:hypothetical protein